jgi:2'-5' RNA ligase
MVVAPHITLIYPFMPASRLNASVEEELRRLVARFEPFDFELAQVGRFPGILYLVPEPAEPFVALVEALSARWPEHPPYRGAFDTVIRHLTVAHGRGPLALTDELARALPIRASATEVDLMVMGRNGRWSQRASFRLGER